MGKLRIQLRVTRPAAAACAVAALALLLSACGGDEGGPIPSAEAAELILLLDETDRRMDARNACGDIEREDLPRLDEIAAGMSGEVGSDAREALRNAVARLRDLVGRECEEIRAERQRESEREQPAPPIPEPPRPEPEPDENDDDDRDGKPEPPGQEKKDGKEKQEKDGGGGQQGPGGAGEGGVRIPEVLDGGGDE